MLEFEAAGTESDFDLGGLALAAGQRIVAVQRLCNDWSNASPPVVVSPPWDLEPKILEPLTDCAPIVVIQDVSPSALVIVTAQRRKGELGRKVADSTMIAIGVSPFLETGDTIEVNILGCHPAQLRADVAAPVDIPLAQVVQAYIGTRTIVVEPVIPGSTVDVLISGHHAGERIRSKWLCAYATSSAARNPSAPRPRRRPLTRCWGEVESIAAAVTGHRVRWKS
jgi:hypothetical protein